MYRSVDTSMWFDDKFQSLQPLSRYLFVYLLTNPHQHMSGICYLPKPLMALETGLPETKIYTLYDTLCDTMAGVGFVKYDSKYSICWVIKFLKHQGSGPRVFKGCATHIQTLHNSYLIKEFLDYYPAVKKLVPDRVYQRVSHTMAENGLQDKDKDLNPNPLNSSSVVLKDFFLSPEMVLRFWNEMNLVPCKKMGSPLHRKMEILIKMHPEKEWWMDLFVRISNSDFLSGRSKDWSATLDWALGPKNLAKIEQGNYDNRKSTSGADAMKEAFLKS